MTKWIKRGAVGLLLLLLVAALAAWWLLRGSLPRLDGRAHVPGLSAPVMIERDALGVITIDAANETDAMRALGYVHAQERYFEMDLLRRTAAGELAALFGPIALDTDKRHRVHRMRARAVADLDRLLGDRRGMAQAYVDGVNSGLDGLDVRPWPYLLLRAKPEPWRLEDSALTGYAMYFDLQDEANARELAMSRLRPHLPPALYALLAHDGSSWDAPLVGAPRGDAVLPDVAAVDLRKLAMPAGKKAAEVPRRAEVGSNNFAVSGALTGDGRAIVADDMHLGLRAPNIWFRARLRYPDPRAADGRVDATGFTLPGMPALVVGSNGQVAWAFTNSYGDWLDWQRQPACAKPCAGHRYVDERIRIAGATDAILPVEETAWGPVLHREADGSTLALRWSAHLPGSLTMGLADMLHAQSLDDALRIADGTAIPAQNLVIGGRDGRIAWRLLGPVPERAPTCAATEVTTAQACPPWSLTSASGVALPPGSLDRLWTANNRTLDGDLLARVGDGGYANGARAGQIRDGLMSRQRFGERDLLAIQLDDRARFLERWWQLLRERGTKDASSPALRELAVAAANWQQRASTDSVGYRVVRAWRLAVHDRLLDGMTAPAQAAMGDAFEMPDLTQFEGVAWPLATQRPPHLLPRRFASWDALFEDAARDVRDELGKRGPLAQRTWGERNTASICHPLASALPGFMQGALCMPPDELPGDSAMPRVQSPTFGASERMVVSPGHEADGIVHMPGGQSGHPLSPFWGAGHDDWVHGRPTPFLPGTVARTLRLVPPQR